MNLSRLRTGELGISARLLIWFLTIALIPCGTVALVIELITSRALETSVKHGLALVSENKAEAIETFVRERRGDVGLAGRLQFVVSAVTLLTDVLAKHDLDSPEYARASAASRKMLSYYQDAYGYSDALLFGMDGKLLLRIHDDLNLGANLKSGPLKDSELADVFDRARMLLQSEASDFQVYPGERQPRCFVAAPIFDRNGVNIGVVVLQIGNKEVYGILHDFEGLGTTGEVIAAQLKGDEVMLISPMRFDPHAAFRRKTRLGSSVMMATQQSVQGVRGFAVTPDYRGVMAVDVTTYVPSLRWGLLVKQDVSEAYEIVHRLRWVIGGLLALTIAGVVVVARAVARSLSGPVVAAVEVAQKVASGDLTADTDVKATGEIGKLIRGIRTMTADLRTLIGKIQKSSISLMSAATQIAATSRQQQSLVHDYGASTNEAAAAVKEISATGQELLRTMTEVNQLVVETAALASHGQDSLSGMDRTMRLLADSTASIGSKLSVISERAATINLVVTTITKVADQTNLLSINAAIEAEKAGEYGLGFLVVAREIRRLADQTAVSTLDIESMVKEMQYSVSAGVMEMDKFSDQVRQGVREVASIGNQLGSIISAVHGLTGRFDQVTEGMRVQSQGADQIREAVVHLSDGMNQTLTSLREFNQATAQLREAVGGLKEEVSRFKVDAS